MSFIIDSRFENEIVDLANEIIEDELFDQDDWDAINPQQEARTSATTYRIEMQDDEAFLVRTTTYVSPMFGETKVHVFAHNLTKNIKL